jgi:hypothetical protein
MQSATYRLAVADLVDADLVDARSYVYSSLPLVRAIRLVPFALSLACLLFGAYLALQRDWTGVTGLVGWFFLGVALIVWIYVGNRLLLPHSVRKQLARSSGLQDEVVASWDFDQIILEAKHGQSRWPWRDFYRWQESSGGVLLWQSDRIYNYLPKRVLTDDQISEIRNILTNVLGKPGKRRK